jgi:hypothetical protein
MHGAGAAAKHLFEDGLAERAVGEVVKRAGKHWGLRVTGKTVLIEIPRR